MRNESGAFETPGSTYLDCWAICDGKTYGELRYSSVKHAPQCDPLVFRLNDTIVILQCESIIPL